MTTPHKKPLTFVEAWLEAQSDVLMLLGDVCFALRLQALCYACYQRAAGHGGTRR